MAIFLLAAREFAPAGVGKVVEALLPAMSVIVPPFSERAAVEI